MGGKDHWPVALVTGASRGVGKGVALALNAAGFRVYATGQFIGAVIAALREDPGLMKRTGQVLITAAVARELGVFDVDGRSPDPLSIEAL